MRLRRSSGGGMFKVGGWKSMTESEKEAMMEGVQIALSILCVGLVLWVVATSGPQ